MDEDFDIREERYSKVEKDFENALRPLSFKDFSGQKKIVENLEVFAPRPHPATRPSRTG